MPKGYVLTKDGYVEAGKVVKPEEQTVAEKKEEVLEEYPLFAPQPSQDEIPHTGRHRRRK